MILDDIIQTKKKEVAYNKEHISFSHLDRAIARRTKYISFKKALQKEKSLALIAEIKKASPSAGIIRKEFDHLKIAALYEEEGADAISVLTDKQYFQGDIEYLNEIRMRATVPLLRKDFIIDEYQIFESAASGADAILLIAAVLTIPQLKHYIATARNLNLASLVEIHDLDDVKKIREVQPEIVGINNRNLQTFAVDITTTETLRDELSYTPLLISESGIHTVLDILYLKRLNISGILVGGALMKEENIRQKMKEFTAAL